MWHPLLAFVSLFSSSSQIKLLSRVISIFSPFSFTLPIILKFIFSTPIQIVFIKAISDFYITIYKDQRPIFSPHLAWCLLLGTVLLTFSRRLLARSGGIFGCQIWKVCATIFIEGTEIRDAAKHSCNAAKDSSLPPQKHYLVPRIYTVEVEKLGTTQTFNNIPQL